MTPCQKNAISKSDTVSKMEKKMSLSQNQDQRKSEIIKACRELYQKIGFQEITIKAISTYTSFSRPSIYNYFPTKESIFLEIFREEYIYWCDEMKSILDQNHILSLEDFSDQFSKTLENRPVLLKLLSMNIYDLERNCSLEELTEFKKEYKRALDLVSDLLRKFFPNMNEKQIDRFIYIFFPFMFGLYPYVNVTQKQKEAMNAVGIHFPIKRVYDFVYETIFELLKNNISL